MVEEVLVEELKEILSNVSEQFAEMINNGESEEFTIFVVDGIPETLSIASPLMVKEEEGDIAFSSGICNPEVRLITVNDPECW